MADSCKSADGTSTTNVSRRQVLQSSAATLVVGGLAGCLGALDEDDDVVRIGAVIPLTGALAFGEEMENGLELALDEHDGDEEVELLVRDSETDPGTATPATNELIQEDGVDFIIGGVSSASALAIQETIDREQVPYISIASSEGLTGEACSQYAFAHHSSSTQFSGAPLLAYEEGIFDSMYFLPANFEGGLRAREAVANRITDRGANDMGQSEFPLGNDDYSAQISDARGSDADICYFISSGEDAIRFLSQAHSAGLHDDMDIMFSFIDIEIAASVDEEIEGVYGGTSFYWEVDDGAAFTENYRETFGEVPPWWAATAYDSAREFLWAFEEEGSTDADAIVDRLRGNEFDWSRPCQWRECDHRSIKEMYLVEGRPVDEREEDDAYYEVLGSAGGEEIMRSCDDTGCEMD